MRIFFFIMMANVGLIIQAQTPLTFGNRPLFQQRSFAGNSHFTDSIPAKKWFVTKYVGIFAGINFFDGNVVPVIAVVLTFVAPLYTSYPVTATLSVAPLHDKETEFEVFPEVLKIVAVGACVSRVMATMAEGVTSA